ncbi:hypothetical protein M3Y97_00754700 [Aphelenchoides bicaudatus]|nr:hypothetical protein M3Y97_00754700 [Aphelenchoides bicaudatus]
MLKAPGLVAFLVCVFCFERSASAPIHSTFVISIDSTDFELSIYPDKNQHASTVLFMHTSSKLSQDYAKTFSDVCKVAGNWTGINFYTVDCDKTVNKELCKEHSVRRVPPVMKYFKVGSYSGDLGKKLKTYTNATNILTEIAQNLNKDYKRGACRECPNLEPFPADIGSLSDVWGYMRENCYRLIFLVPVNSMDEPDGVTRLADAFRIIGKKMHVWRIPKNSSLLHQPDITVTKNDMMLIARFDKDVWTEPDQFSKPDFESKLIQGLRSLPATRKYEELYCGFDHEPSDVEQETTMRLFGQYFKGKKAEYFDYGPIEICKYI